MADSKKPTSSNTKTTAAKAKSKSAEEKQKIKEKEMAEAEKLHRSKRLHDEIWAIVIIALGVLVVLSLHSNLIGALGAVTKSVMFGIFGRVAYILAYFLIAYGILIFLNKTSYLTLRSLLCLLALFICVCMLNASLYDGLGTQISGDLIREAYKAETMNIGVFGAIAGTLLNKLAGLVGMRIIAICGIVITLMFIIDTPISVFFDNLKIKRRAVKNTREAQKAANEMILERERERKEEEHQMAMEEMARQREEAAKKSNAADYTKGETHPTSGETLQQTPAPVPVQEPAPEPVLELPTFNPNFTPETIGRKSADSPEAPVTNNQKQILGYMNDDSLFGQDGPIKEGYGLNGEGSPKAAVPEYNGSFIPQEVSHEEPAPERPRAPRKPRTEKPAEPAAPAPVKSAPAAEPSAAPVYQLPPIELLHKPSGQKEESDMNAVQEQARVLEETLASFGVSASVENMIKGPTVTRFEVKPAPGVKISRIVSLQDDLALNLRAKSLRIEAPIPGKAAVGIEISNDKSSSVTLREVLESKEFQSAKSKISVGLGKNVGGECVVADLKKMPHLLIAGTTGSGKSVFLNSLILSILYRAKPEEVQMIMVDPKKVELVDYNGIPHLRIPVVTEPNLAAEALNGAVKEMTGRYKKFADLNVRDIKSYNAKIRENPEEYSDREVLPQIVIIVDEFADLMMTASKDVEQAVVRLAQLARAAGIHLVIATQRPTANVITGLIKSNIQSRVALTVASGLDSRTILDMNGAEKLLGHGDMLFYPTGYAKPIRVQGCWVTDQEIEAVTSFWKKQGAVTEEQMKKQSYTWLNDPAEREHPVEDERDEMFLKAAEYIIDSEKASIGNLQRVFRIGFNRAARIMDQLADAGIVGKDEGTKARQILLDRGQFEDWKRDNGY